MFHEAKMDSPELSFYFIYLFSLAKKLYLYAGADIFRKQLTLLLLFDDGGDDCYVITITNGSR